MLTKDKVDTVELNNLMEVSKIMDSRQLNNNNMDNKQQLNSNMDNKHNMELNKGMDNKWEIHTNRQHMELVQQVVMELQQEELELMVPLDMASKQLIIHMVIQQEVWVNKHSQEKSKCHIMELLHNHNHMDQQDRKTLLMTLKQEKYLLVE
jgi:hypothetical protein